ncbi:hypothetical protein COEREDRAFT_89450 [Coemansia reversa NRRL 1564]|uniref:F-box domain-containing protein n=1 Tax=Coemansia reversa (strain ATCC 12441 / NRRL 1564) TaxID=763665 RepID=A0A2G5B3K4_COERN|nr:hypothetical protein COEREDRAFT_89450 [Coemansia reversa NRRL 1564]|eukprot:PIA13586.1 hypothetical protein COEREDRAFT_89450 [Coemansia reversa NRRL 1564]
MPVVSAAQALPAHIIEEIVSYIYTLQQPSEDIIDFESPHRPVKLIPLLGICSRWRYIVCAIFYHSVILCIDKPNTFEIYKSHLLRMEEAIENKCEHYICHIDMVININDFCQHWDIHSSNHASILKKCGPLPTVHIMEAYIIQECQLEDDKSIITDRPLEDCLKDIDSNIHTFADALEEILPNRARVEVFRDTIDSYLDTDKPIEEIVTRLNSIINRHTTQLILLNMRFTKHLLTDLPNDSLQIISLVDEVLPKTHVALIQRNINSLEQLYICGTDDYSINSIIIDDASKNNICIYPRLRRLHISECVASNKTINQSTADPFPQLESLECEGKFPFHSTGVLKQGRSHICKLVIYLNDELMEHLTKDGIFTKNAFAQLRSVTLCIDRFDSSNTFNNMNMLVAKAFNLCESTHKIKFSGIKLKNIVKDISELNVSEKLHHLDVRATPLTIDMVIKVLYACPRLLVADIYLQKDPDCWDRGVPANSLLKCYQNEYSDLNFSVLRLNLKKIKFPTIRRASEFILLLVDIVSSITHVRLSRGYSLDMKRVVKSIRTVRKRPAYVGHTKLDNVKFTAKS